MGALLSKLGCMTVLQSGQIVPSAAVSRLADPAGAESQDALRNEHAASEQRHSLTAAAALKPCILNYDRLAPTLFHQPWWLEIVTGGDYGIAVSEQAGRVVGKFPYAVKCGPGGTQICGMPPMTHFLGPGIDDGSGAACNRILRRAQITRDLIRQLPASSGYWQKLHRDTPETLAFLELGFQTAVQFTFEVAPAEPAILWRNMRDKTRNVIRRAEERHRVVDIDDFDMFAHTYLENLKARHERSYYEMPLIRAVCEATTRRGHGRVIAAEDGTGNIVAAIFYVWDTQAAYYMLSTRSSEAGNGAVSLLLWEAMKDIASRNLIFDFEGVITAGSALFFTGFGGQITPRYVVSKFTARHKLITNLYKPFRRTAVGTYL